jgi:hypothetical protein
VLEGQAAHGLSAAPRRFSRAGIVSQRWEWVTVHVNLAGTVTRQQHGDLFIGAIVEGPRGWTVRPVAELFHEREFGQRRTNSALVGILWKSATRSRSTPPCAARASTRARWAKYGSDWLSASAGDEPKNGFPDIPAIDLLLFAIASLAASLVAGLAGFAFGLVAAALLLHVLTPLQTTALIVGFGLLVRGFSVWKLRRALLPFVVGGALGVPIGAAALDLAAAAARRRGRGAHRLQPFTASRGRSFAPSPADAPPMAESVFSAASRQHDRAQRHSADNLVRPAGLA